MIWVHEPNDTVLWLTEAMDENTIDVNGEAWDDALAKAYKAHGPGNVRVIKAPLPYTAVEAAFAAPVVPFGAVIDGSTAVVPASQRGDDEFFPGDRVAYFGANGIAAGTVDGPAEHLSGMYRITPFVNGPAALSTTVAAVHLTLLGNPE